VKAAAQNSGTDRQHRADAGNHPEPVTRGLPAAGPLRSGALRRRNVSWLWHGRFQTLKARRSGEGSDITPSSGRRIERNQAIIVGLIASCRRQAAVAAIYGPILYFCWRIVKRSASSERAAGPGTCAAA
jgi:hypothetical protein